MTEDKDRIISLQRKKIDELSKKVNALEQEIALLNHEKKQNKKGEKIARSLKYI